MKLWVDDLRPVPEGYIWAKSVDEAKKMIYEAESAGAPFTLIDVDHDAGDYAREGGDYIRLLDWLEATRRSYPIAIHTMNPVGRSNMLAIVWKNRWKLVR
ncbi:MAG: hypothetical protein IJX71_03625 [Oscillospiraceae bacterium]|nr:hypothetical protein [Oscillospiraceae bacterium]